MLPRVWFQGKILGIGLDGDGMDEKAFKYLELAACKVLDPSALTARCALVDPHAV